uniref:Ig-like domain-containing protein n=1 Tax=Pseudonaja textilis TaxID=8673 RepID=A0A670ZGG8_PSETE
MRTQIVVGNMLTILPVLQAGQTYTITMSPSVSVQRGFTVYIPCQFTYNQRDLAWNEKVLAYWIKRSPQRYPCSPPLNQNCLPVATNDQNQIVERSAKDRFYLSGDPMKGSCSLVIRNARIEDEGQYYLRIEGKWDLKFSFIQESGKCIFLLTLSFSSFSTDSVFLELDDPMYLLGTFTFPLLVFQNCPRKSVSQFQIMEPFKHRTGVNHVIVKEGNSIILTCTADGRPSPNLSWMKEDQKIGEPTGHLQLHQIRPEDAGKYQCVANNQYGSLKTMVEVIVQCKIYLLLGCVAENTHPLYNPEMAILWSGRWVDGTGQLTAQEGDSLEVFCKADSNPPAATSWVKGDSPLQKPLDNQLRLTNLTIADEGAYVCKATNMFGSIQRTFHPTFGKTMSPFSFSCRDAKVLHICPKVLMLELHAGVGFCRVGPVWVNQPLAPMIGGLRIGSLRRSCGLACPPLCRTHLLYLLI